MKATLRKFHNLTQEENTTVEDCHQYIHEIMDELQGKLKFIAMYMLKSDKNKLPEVRLINELLGKTRR